MQFTKMILSASLVLALGLIPVMPLRAETGTETTSLKLNVHRRTASDAEQLTEENMLTDLRDTRLCLTQLKQQAVNLYQEATRTVITVDVPPLEQTPTVIESKMLDEQAKYIAPRKEWLVYYINNLEPIVHLLSEDIQDVDTNGRKVPANIEEKINPMWTTWRANVADINKRLDEIQGLIGADNGNVALAKAAIAIYTRAEELEKVRYKVALIFREEYRKTKPKTSAVP